MLLPCKWFFGTGRICSLGPDKYYTKTIFYVNGILGFSTSKKEFGMKWAITLLAVVLTVFCFSLYSISTKPSLLHLLRSNASDEEMITALRQGADVNERYVVFSGIGYGRNRSGIVKGGLSILHMALFMNRSIGLVDQLIKSGANLKTRDFDGNTVMHYALANCTNRQIVDRIIAAGASMMSVNDIGQTPVLYALDVDNALAKLDSIWQGESLPQESSSVVEGMPNDVKRQFRSQSRAIKENVTRAVTRLNVNVADANGMTALMYAAKYGDMDVLRSILEAGAFVNTKSKNGQTALIIAVKESGTDGTISALLKAGADAKIRDNEGMTAFDHAIRKMRSGKGLQIGAKQLAALKDTQY